jgi:HPt (histidine-containing phosphotransfer) domain-containing protein
MLDQAIKFWQKTEGLKPYKTAIETVLSKCNNNKKLILSLYLKLFEELPQQISNIEEALNKKQYKLAFDINHKLNGSVKICYLQEFHELAMALEMCLIQRNYEFADGYFSMLQQQASSFMGYRQPILEYLTQIQNI